MWKYYRLMAPLEPAGGDGGSGDGQGGAADGGKPGGTQGDGTGTTDKGGQGTGAQNTDGGQKRGDDGTGAGKESKWMLADGIEGTGKAPEFFKADKYKSVLEQAKALPELESRLGKAATVLGAPSEGNYALPEVKIPIEGAEARKWTWDEKDPVLVAFRTVAKEMDLSQAAFNQVASVVAQSMAGQQLADEKALADSLATLGNDVPARVDAVNAYLKAQFGDASLGIIDQAVGTNPQAFAIIEKMVAKLSGDPKLASQGNLQPGRMSKAEIQAEQFKKFPEGHAKAGQSMYEHDAEHRARVDKLWKDNFPGDDVQEVG